MFLYEAIYGKTIFFSNASQMFFNTNYMMLHVKVMAHTEQLNVHSNIHLQPPLAKIYILIFVHVYILLKCSFHILSFSSNIMKISIYM